MTGEEMERAIEFLLKSQARSEARFESEREQTNRQIRDLAATQQRTQEQLDQLSNTVSAHSQQIIAQSQQISHLGDIASELADGQRRGREDMDALVKLVGGLIEGRDGSGSEGH